MSSTASGCGEVPGPPRHPPISGCTRYWCRDGGCQSTSGGARHYPFAFNWLPLLGAYVTEGCPNCGAATTLSASKTRLGCVSCLPSPIHDLDGEVSRRAEGLSGRLGGQGVAGCDSSWSWVG